MNDLISKFVQMFYNYTSKLMSLDMLKTIEIDRYTCILHFYKFKYNALGKFVCSPTCIFDVFCCYYFTYYIKYCLHRISIADGGL